MVHSRGGGSRCTNSEKWTTGNGAEGRKLVGTSWGSSTSMEQPRRFFCFSCPFSIFSTLDYGPDPMLVSGETENTKAQLFSPRLGLTVEESQQFALPSHCCCVKRRELQLPNLKQHEESQGKDPSKSQQAKIKESARLRSFMKAPGEKSCPCSFQIQVAACSAGLLPFHLHSQQWLPESFSQHSRLTLTLLPPSLTFLLITLVVPGRSRM